jgi:regulator of cell morphogenesis and NO signaling
MSIVAEVVMSLSSETKIKDIALSHSTARHILEDAGLDYCCGGGKSLQEACLHADVPAEQILKRLSENSAEVGPNDENWTSASLVDLTRHIRESHHRYVRGAIARVQDLLDKVAAKHGENHREILEIRRLFIEVGKEMVMHMQKEEQILFPYIDALDRANRSHASVEPPFFQTVKNPIHAMMKEHDAAGELLRQIRNASSEYTVPADACTSFKALYQDLKEFEADLHQHVHLEDNILFPRAVGLETVSVKE